MRKIRYVFMGREGNVLIWNSVQRVPGDSRVEEIRVSARYFWAPELVTEWNRHVSVHVTHCCALHWCKYGRPTCPVVTGRLRQRYMCETCSWELYEDGGWEAAHAMNEMWDTAFGSGYDKAKHEHKCGCDRPYGPGCDA